MFFKKKSKNDKDKSKAEPSPEMSVRLDTLETESVLEQLRDIEKKKVGNDRKTKDEESS